MTSPLAHLPSSSRLLSKLVPACLPERCRAQGNCRSGGSDRSDTREPAGDTAGPALHDVEAHVGLHEPVQDARALDQGEHRDQDDLEHVQKGRPHHRHRARPHHRRRQVLWLPVHRAWFDVVRNPSVAVVTAATRSPRAKLPRSSGNTTSSTAIITTTKMTNGFRVAAQVLVLSPPRLAAHPTAGGSSPARRRSVALSRHVVDYRLRMLATVGQSAMTSSRRANWYVATTTALRPWLQSLPLGALIPHPRRSPATASRTRLSQER